jgi:hypothetical protein
MGGHRQLKFTWILAWCCVASLACSLTGAAPTIQVVTRQPPSPTTLDVTLAPVVTATQFGATGTPMPTADPCPAQPDSSPASYTVATLVDVQSRTVTASVEATYRNESDAPLEMLAMLVDSNRVPGAFVLTDLRGTKDTAVKQYTLTGPRLDIQLASPLAVGCTASIAYSFKLNIFKAEDARLPYLAYTDYQLNLGHWLPQFPPILKGEWIIPREWTIGEYWTDALGDYDVQVRLVNAAQASVIGPGDTKRVNDDTWHFTLNHARSFTVAVSAAMSSLSKFTKDGLLIELYYLTDGQPAKSPDGKPINGPQHALDTAVAAAEQFTEMLGTLPYQRLVVVEGDFRDGMEFSGVVYVGRRWFDEFDGKIDSWLTLITAHEITHQWWYSLVANDQNEAPFLDEGLAIYGEALYLQAHYPELVPWWWTFRVKIFQPQGFVDAKSDEFSSGRLYINAVYLRGALMLQAIREVIGDAAFVAWLERYTKDNWGRIATVQDFWGAMEPLDYQRIEDVRRQYLRDRDPLQSALTPTPAG